MKITNMSEKTSIEIQDTDVLVIEDEYNTQKIQVKELKDYILNINEIKKQTKSLINETIDNIIASLLASKYVLTKPKSYTLNTWIGSTSGNIQISLRDNDDNHWLTSQEIFDLLEPTEDGFATKEFSIEVSVDGLYNESVMSYSIRDFNTEHENAIEINEVLSTSNAGFIKAHFDGLTQNQIAGIKYSDIFIILDDSKEYCYSFAGEPESFANAVPFEETLE